MRVTFVLGFNLAVGCAPTPTLRIPDEADAAPARESHTDTPASGLQLRVTPAVPQAPLTKPVELHLSPGNAVFILTSGVPKTISSLSPGRYTASIVSEGAWAEPQTFEITDGEETELTLPVLPLSPPCWKTSSDTCFVVDVSHAEKVYTIFRWAGGFIPDAHLTPHSEEIVEELRWSSQKTSHGIPPTDPVPTIAFGPGSSMRRVTYAARLLDEVGYDRISFYAQEFPPAPDLRQLSALPPVESKIETDSRISREEAEAAFLREEIWFRQCFAEQEEKSDWVLLSLDVDIDGLVTKAPLAPGPSRPEAPLSERETCTDYDHYMGECEQTSTEEGPPVQGGLWDCLPDAARRLRFPVDESAPSIRTVLLEVKGTWLEPERQPQPPRDEFGK